MDASAGNELERRGGVLCGESESSHGHVTDALGGRLRASLGGADRPLARRSRRLLVRDAHLDRNGLQRLQARPLGLASQQNARGQSRGTALAGHGGRSGVERERGLPGGDAAGAEPPCCQSARHAYCSSPAQATCGSATQTPLELRGAWTPEPGGSAVQRRDLAVWQIASGSVARDHHGSQEIAFCVRPASARAETGAETPRSRTGAHCGLTAQKNLSLKGIPTTHRRLIPCFSKPVVQAMPPGSLKPPRRCLMSLRLATFLVPGPSHRFERNDLRILLAFGFQYANKNWTHSPVLLSNSHCAVLWGEN
jgi:hypothetical protein